MSRKLVVIALGGNAIKQADEKGTTEEQMNNVDIAAINNINLFINSNILLLECEFLN